MSSTARFFAAICWIICTIRASPLSIERPIINTRRIPPVTPTTLQINIVILTRLSITSCASSERFISVFDSSSISPMDFTSLLRSSFIWALNKASVAA